MKITEIPATPPPPPPRTFSLEVTEDELVILAALAYRYQTSGNSIWRSAPLDIRDKARDPHPCVARTGLDRR